VDFKALVSCEIQILHFLTNWTEGLTVEKDRLIDLLYQYYAMHCQNEQINVVVNDCT